MMAFERNMDPKKTPMPTQDAEKRSHNFEEVAPVSYTHLDVYKRQGLHHAARTCARLAPPGLSP